MSDFKYSIIDNIIDDLRSKTNLDIQDYTDFFVGIFFVIFSSIHNRKIDDHLQALLRESIKTSRNDIVISTLLQAADQVDSAYSNELNLRIAIQHLTERVRNPFAVTETCIQLYELISSHSFPAAAGSFFEKIIQHFAEAQGKRAGEAYTPRELVKMMVDIVEPVGGESLYDPTCGSGGFLISANINALTCKRSGPLKIYGREINSSAARIAKINCIVHGVTDFEIRKSDSLQEVEASTYDIVLANPPFSLSTSSYQAGITTSYFDFGAPPPNKADFAFLQMILKSLKPDGRAAVLVPNGVLFRGGLEGAIRRSIIQNGLVDAVIALPGGMLKNTGIPTAVLVLKKPGTTNKPVLLIDSPEAEKYANDNSPMESRAPFYTTLEIYKTRSELEGISKLITNEQLENNGYSLSPSRYMENKQLQKNSITILTEKQKDLETQLAELQKEFSELLT
ncbi:HsdM family class I SAM-dependent methyltransferase [Pseudomonas sp. 22373]|uniref:HsdM family class I SAM-dependent methyltransferase n=1 Tax=Pseudomonas TaxID=286 RepID=UPI000A117352|nr:MULTISPECIES: N-6 DNA methylase [Pseudomonas]MDH1930691.1 SAM-dependent methyltransferase [Pseudomonas sp. GD03696]ORL65197.1 hypothetical protein B7H19_23485 [Pseudomonas putida]